MSCAKAGAKKHPPSRNHRSLILNSMISTTIITMALLHVSRLKSSSAWAPAFTSIRKNIMKQSSCHTRTIIYPGNISPLGMSSFPTSVTNRYSSTSLKVTSELNDKITANDDHNYPQINDKPKPKTRKQRSRHAKEYPLQRIDKVLADRGLGTRSKTFELAKSGRIATAASPDGK